MRRQKKEKKQQNKKNICKYIQSLSKVVGTPTVSRYICLFTIIPSKNLTSPSPAPPFNVGFDV